jgi:hypothetical protein
VSCTHQRTIYAYSSIGERRAIIVRVSEATPGVPAENMRVSDAERAQVQDRLRRAHDLGQLDLTEFDERVRTVWAARTRGDLAGITADLPAPPPSPVRPGVFSPTPGGMAMRVLTLVWLSTVVVNLTVWGIVALTVDESVYPWWLWAAGPPGAVLAVLYATGIGRPRR